MMIGWSLEYYKLNSTIYSIIIKANILLFNFSVIPSFLTIKELTKNFFDFLTKKKRRSSLELMFTPAKASVFNLPKVIAIIDYLIFLERATNRTDPLYNPSYRLYESDYTRLMAAILPYYFHYGRGWNISPEVWGDTNWGRDSKSDLVISRRWISPSNNIYRYGQPLNWAMIEFKKWGVISWHNLVEGQLWNQADSLELNGKLWVIALRGLEMGVFRFNHVDFPDDTDTYTNFSPLNLNNFSDVDLNRLGIDHVTVSNNQNQDIVRVIQWRLDNVQHHGYIHDMLNYISQNNV